jgi:hypothetical protein
LSGRLAASPNGEKLTSLWLPEVLGGYAKSSLFDAAVIA